MWSMEVLLLDNKRITKVVLPNEIKGVYSLKYMPLVSCNFKEIYIEASNDKWILKSNPMLIYTINKKQEKDIELKEGLVVTITLYDSDETLYLYCLPNLFSNSVRYINNFKKIKIGSTNQCSIIVKDLYSEIILGEILKENDIFYISSKNNPETLIYLNNTRVSGIDKVCFGDVIFINGLRIILMNDFIQVNGLFSNYEFNLEDFVKYDENDDDTLKENNILLDNEPNNKKNIESFCKRNVVNENIKILLPPTPDDTLDRTLISFVFTFLIISLNLILIYSLVGNVKTENDTKLNCLLIFLCLCLLIGFGLFFYFKWKRNKNARIQKENDYIDYLKNCENNIKEIILNQEKDLNFNFPPLSEYYNKINNSIIWSRNIKNKDFLNIRLGSGSQNALINISPAEETFTFTNNILIDKMYKLVDEERYLKNIPILYNFTNEKIMNLNVNKENYRYFDMLISQIVSLHSPLNLKLSFFLKNDEFDLEYIKQFPHIFSDDRMIRYYAKDEDEMNVVSNYLSNIFEDRVKTILNNISLFKNKGKKMYLNFDDYYLIFVDDKNSLKNFEIFSKIKDYNGNIGFSVIYIGNDNDTECNFSINVSSNSYLLNNEKNEKIYFKVDNLVGYDNYLLGSNLLKKYDFKNVNINSLPTPLSLLRLYGIIFIEQLDLLESWKKNNSSCNMKTLIGKKKNNTNFYLDTSDNADGPHGIIVGNAACGKTEFLMTFILSMSINYNPCQVQFIICESSTGKIMQTLRSGKYSIPHLLASYNEIDLMLYQKVLDEISDELKYREKKFEEAISVTNDVAMDIYKYQKYYREGFLKESISHLYIIIDDFDKICDDSEDFINNLMTIIMVGHLFGIHLILSLENEELLKNIDIIEDLFFKVKLNARINSLSFKDIGTFQLFTKAKKVPETGQFAYSNVKYDPYRTKQKNDDSSILFIDNVGRIIEASDDYLNNKNNIIIKDEKTVLANALIEWNKTNFYLPRKLGKEKRKGVRK